MKTIYYVIFTVIGIVTIFPIISIVFYGAVPVGINYRYFEDCEDCEIESNNTSEQSMSKHCDIPYDVNFVKQRNVISAPNDGEPHYSIAQEFSIHSTVSIDFFAIDEDAHSLILKPVQNSYGYVIMCDPLPVLEKRFETQMHGLFVLVDGEEIEPNLVNDVLRINVNGNTRIEIIGFRFV